MQDARRLAANQSRMRYLFLLALAVCGAPGASAADAVNLVGNAGFEAGAAGWEKRTPDGPERALSITPEAARTGGQGARIVNRRAGVSRWRQGAEGKLAAAPGAIVRLSGWIRADLGPEGYAALRLYCMRAPEDIAAQPQSRPLTGRSDWTRVSVTSTVPAGTTYLMAYLELQNAVGTADYDDLSLTLVAPAEPPEPPARDLLLLTDAPADDPTLHSLDVLYPGRLVRRAPGEAVEWPAFQGAIVLLRRPEDWRDPAAAEPFAASGKPVVLDLAAYAHLRKLEVRESTGEDAPTLRVTLTHAATKGFAVGDSIPWHGGTRGGYTQRALASAGAGVTLAESSRGGALLVVEEHGKGTLLATDLLGLPEPAYNRPGGINKHLFLGNLLGGSVRWGRHFARRFSYAEFVDAMRALAGQHPAIRVQDEGPANGDYRLPSLNLGDPAKPALFLYAAAHGSEWEPAYGLLELARLLATRPGDLSFDLGRFSVKILPILNPSGYDRFTRHSAARVDLNRNGGEWWHTFTGRDSNADGAWGPGDYDWKGSSPFSEPETQTYRAICERLRPYATLDLHGNQGGRGNNRLVVMPLTAHAQNEERVYRAVRAFNRAVRNRYALLEAQRPGVEQYEIEAVQWDSPRPTLIQTACKGGFGFLCEVPAGYGGTYGIVFQTDVVVETCVAFFRAYADAPQ